MRIGRGKHVSVLADLFTVGITAERILFHYGTENIGIVKRCFFQNDKCRLVARIDAELADDFIDDEVVSQESQDALVEIFRKNLGKEKLEIKVQNMKDEDVAAIITLSEEQRRMQDMMKMYGMGDDPNMFGGQETLVLNANHPLVKYVLENRDAETVPVFCRQLYDLAMISHKPLNQTEMNEFVKRSNEIMMLLTK